MRNNNNEYPLKNVAKCFSPCPISTTLNLHNLTSCQDATLSPLTVIKIWAPVKGIFGVGVTLLWGSSYGEVSPNVGIGAGIGYIKCKTEKLKCVGPCAPY